MSDEDLPCFEKQVKSINEKAIVLHRKDFYYGGRGSWEMTHNELIDVCIELNKMYQESQAKLFEEYKRI